MPDSPPIGDPLTTTNNHINTDTPESLPHEETTHVDSNPEISNEKPTSPNRLRSPSDERLPTPVSDRPPPEDNKLEEPPNKRRKLNGPDNEASPRPISPPWKRVIADGPTSFLENGRRKSGRTNAVPLALQPQSNKRQTRAQFDKTKVENQKQVKPNYNLSTRTPKVETPVAAQTKSTNLRHASLRNQEQSNGLKIVPIQRKSKESATESKVSATSPRKTTRRSTSTPVHPRGGKSPAINGQVANQNRVNGIIKKEPEDNDEESELSSIVSSRSPSPPLALRKVTFRVRLLDPSITSPANLPSQKKYASFREFIEKDELDPRAGEDLLTQEQIEREAVARNRLFVAQQLGGILNKGVIDRLPEKQNEPRRQYAHHDHLLAHVHHFRLLLRHESRDHKRKAELLAHEAKRYVEERQRRNKVKTKEEIEKEVRDASIARYRNTVKDLDKLWAGVRAEVDAIRQKQYEEQQQAKMKGHLARVLDKTDQMLARTVEQDESTLNGDDDSSNDDSVSGSDDSQQMSDSESESDPEDEANNHDAEMSIEELKRKYENLPEVPQDEDTAMEDDVEMSRNSEEEDSDPETEMDSEFDTDESEDDDSDDDDDAASDQDSSKGGLLALFSRREIESMAPTEDPDEQDSSADVEDATAAEPSPLIEVLEETEDMDIDGDNSKTPGPISRPQSRASANNVESTHQLTDHDQRHTSLPSEGVGLATDLSYSTSTKASSLPPGLVTSDSEPADVPIKPAVSRPSSSHLRVTGDLLSPEPSAQTSPRTTATKVSEPESASSVDVRAESAAPMTPSDTKPIIKTPVPSLLRATLREYQHEGLDWLADLYATGRSGILADEMGLGKTIQSISLLAHLAEVYQVWGPHLIVVPTSVMLNWEMEFKKFLPGFKILTYYGNQEERKQKRRGWMADDSFNVCITSYQLVIQDANSFKRRKWHYMILDEAHNIKNFRSERWQTMMTFNTTARLLLTGTPLQNNLTELWSLLFFLHYGQESDGEDDAFAGLKEWSEWFKRPVESILEHGNQVLDAEDREQVAKLHKVIRPFLLRRLKRDVEKQMPLKYEHVEICRLSKRQRQLYDGFMARAQTKETLTSGNYLSIINALMQLRKVCNHPDLFETRPINTSFAMPKSVAAGFEIKDFLVRRKLLLDAANDLDLNFLRLAPISDEHVSKIEIMESSKRHAYHQLKALRDSQRSRIADNFLWAGENQRAVLGSLDNVGRKVRLREIDSTMYYEGYRHAQRALYGRGLINRLTINTTYARMSSLSRNSLRTRFWEQESVIEPFLGLIHPLQVRSEQMEPFVQRYACITPAVVATDLGVTTVTESGAAMIRNLSQTPEPVDPFHQARMKLSIAFPDKRLLQYDCGKLQRLDKLLRQLQAGGHRALIFTQMTKVLDILEQFLNIHGHRYLRLDGATKIEQRQILTDRFNNDNRILAFILSSRSGGLGINLTGADTVIFYDLDWNPAMDKQCTDRAHRIGQTRDVHIYRFVSEHTIESNILRKANQKQMLDDVVIQEGEFTTDYVNKLSYRDMLDDTGEEDAAGAAMDRVLGNDKHNTTVLEQAEDQEDRAAAKVAVKEVQNADDGDFEDKPADTRSGTPRTHEALMSGSGPFGATEEALKAAQEEHHIDEYLVKLQLYLVRDIPLGPAKKSKKGKRRDEHRVRKR
ncbi:hypothetical protein B0A52_04253 [Exophiala mesophila]|uniref:DNA helicase n=1 Tax=Exophiala mesophila TaxID=212818 RepID=A0A438N7V6_EXOME|nr:hypothetical protein B0A52_04253 [Exophiala mesophila]